MFKYTLLLVALGLVMSVSAQFKKRELREIALRQDDDAFNFFDDDDWGLDDDDFGGDQDADTSE